MGSNLPAQIGEKLKKLRKEHEMTQEETARAIGCTTKTYRSWEKNSVVPRGADLIAIANLFNVDCDYLIDHIDEKTHDLDFVCKYTGLSAESINVLLYMDKPSKDIIDCLIQEYSGERYRIFTSINGAADAQTVMNHEHNNNSSRNRLALFSMASEISIGIEPTTGYNVPVSAEDIKDLNLDRVAREFRLFAEKFVEKAAKEQEEKASKVWRKDNGEH